MTILSHLLIGYGLSFIGSLPFGIINMTVAHTAIRKGITAALWMAFGAAFIEFFQVFVSLKFTWLFVEGGEVGNILKIVAVAVFLSAGIYFFFFAKTKPPANENEVAGRRRSAFAKGMLVSTLNVMAIPFWIFYGAILTSYDLLKMDNTYVLVFAAGTVMGTFSLLSVYAFLGAGILQKSEQITRWVNKFIGLVLTGFGVYQLWLLCF
jgi:threonine/homoserine/homoserine lactone efflux protein